MLGYVYLTNTPKLSEIKYYQAGFGMIFLGQNPLTFMIPIYSTTVTIYIYIVEIIIIIIKT